MARPGTARGPGSATERGIVAEIVFQFNPFDYTTRKVISEAAGRESAAVIIELARFAKGRIS